MQTLPRRKSIRIPNYNYAQAGAYFITICTQQRSCLFGDVVDFEVSLSPSGIEVSQCWLDVMQKFPFVVVNEWVLMPNHLHAVLTFEDGQGRPATLGRVIGAFKTASTNRLRRANLIGPSALLWQRNYYERVIRTECGFNNMRQYIVDNPVNWAIDPENPSS